MTIPLLTFDLIPAAGRSIFLSIKIFLSVAGLEPIPHKKIKFVELLIQFNDKVTLLGGNLGLSLIETTTSFIWWAFK